MDNSKCNGSYSNEHSLIPKGNSLYCVHCGKQFNKSEVI